MEPFNLAYLTYTHLLKITFLQVNQHLLIHCIYCQTIFSSFWTPLPLCVLQHSSKGHPWHLQCIEPTPPHICKKQSKWSALYSVLNVTELPVLPWLPHFLAIISWVTSRFPWSQYILVCDITFWISMELCQPVLMQNIMSLHHITGPCLVMLIKQMQDLETEVSNIEVRGSKLHKENNTVQPW